MRTEKGQTGRDSQDVAVRVLFENGPGRDEGWKDARAPSLFPPFPGEQEDGRFRFDALDQVFPAVADRGAHSGQDQHGLRVDPADGFERVGAHGPTEQRLEERTGRRTEIRALLTPQKKNDGFPFHAI